jgi:HD-like signal output (HDOD) protein
MYRKVLETHGRQQGSLCDAELEVLGTTHAEVGACLLGAWGLPLSMLEAIFWHHHPQRSLDRRFSLLTAVHAANILAQESGSGSGDAKTNCPIDLGYLMRLGLGDRRNLWRKLCSVPARREDDPPEERHRRRETKDN